MESKMNYTFYQVKSRKNEQVIAGLSQVSLACDSSPDLFVFLWMDDQQNLKHFQFLFFERLLEWREEQGFCLMVTNRFEQHPDGVGYHKGSRSLEDPETLAKAQSMLKEANLPAPYGPLIKALLSP